MNKDILYCDLDGVLADFDKAIHDLAPHVDLSCESFRDEVDQICEANPRIFFNLEVMDGAQSAIQLLDKKYNIYFLSTPMINVKESFMDKMLWLEKYFADVCHKKLILSHNKGLCIGKYLIDDRKVNGVEDFKGEHLHFRTPRFPDWDSILNYLL